jgi:uncharacterized paraquat-inducible protein A
VSEYNENWLRDATDDTKVPDPDPVYKFHCIYCQYEKEATHPEPCPRCTWSPMLRRKEV